MKPQKLLWSLAVLLFSSFIFFACQKEIDGSIEDDPNPVPEGKQALTLYMTDGPGFFDKVLIDIRAVTVVVDTCDRGPRDSCRVTASLNIQAGVYDLLTLRNGVDTMLASGVVPDGKVKEVRITLGTNNSLVKDSTSYPLNLWPGTDSVIVLRLGGDEWDRHGRRRCRLWVDFDVTRSIIVVRNNEFYLKPVLRPFTLIKSGSIEGKVLPVDAQAVVTVYSGTDTSYALPNRKGEFKVRGLLPGTYGILVNAGNGYKDTTLASVQVGIFRETKLPTITLHK